MWSDGPRDFTVVHQFRPVGTDELVGLVDATRANRVRELIEGVSVPSRQDEAGRVVVEPVTKTGFERPVADLCHLRERGDQTVGHTTKLCAIPRSARHPCRLVDDNHVVTQKHDTQREILVRRRARLLDVCRLQFQHIATLNEFALGHRTSTPRRINTTHLLARDQLLRARP